MNLRGLGKTSFQVSEIGLGTAQLANTDGRVAGIKRVPQAEAEKILRTAVEEGVNFFDTGDQYGGAETLLGGLPDSIKDKVLFATKAGLRDDGRRDFSPRYLRERIERSLRRLKTERLGLFQLNKPSPDQLRDGSLLAFLDEEKKAGRLRYAGVVVGEPEAGELCLQSGSVDCLQVLYNLLYQDSAALIDAARERGVGVIARSPLNSGLLSGSYGPATVIPPEDERSRYFTGETFQKRLAALRSIQDELGVADGALVEFSLGFVLSNPAVSVVIPGASTLPQARRYIACSAAARLDPAERRRIAEVAARRMRAVSGPFQLQ